MLVQTTKSTQDAVIDAGQFWPHIDPNAARQAMRLDGTVTNERWKMALIEAAATVMGELAGWRQTQGPGYRRLADIPSNQIDSQSILVHRWLRAVYCLAAASITERYRTFDTTAAGNKKIDDLMPSIVELRRDAAWALQDIRGQCRTTVELI